MSVRTVAGGVAVLLALAGFLACVSFDGLTGGTRDAGPGEAEAGPVEAGEAGDAGSDADAAPAVPVLLAGGLPLPVCVVVDPLHVYWATNRCSGQVCAEELPLVGDAGPSVVAMAPDDYGIGWADCALRVDGSLVVGGSPTGNGLIDRFPPAAMVESRFAYGFAPVVALAVSPSGGIAWTTSNGWVYACGSTCDNNPTTIAAMQMTPAGIATDGVTVYWANLGDDTIRSSPFYGDGGQVSIVASDAASPVDVALDDAGVYWVEATSGNVMALRAGAPSPVVVASGPPGTTAAIALDGDRIYWVSSAGSVMRVEKDGGAPTTLASGQDTPVDVAVDSRFVYWADGVVDGGIYRVAK
ncbi:MAG TPA: hypothetical protein VF765_33290 [Polyangiaceae bacterium]